MIDPFEKLAKSLDVGPVTKPADPVRPQRMNANAFCIRNKVFAMHVREDLVLKLPPNRVADLVQAKVASSNVVGGHVMKEWANLPLSVEKKWLALTKESLDYVRNKR
jgi:hypothetical protein